MADKFLQVKMEDGSTMPLKIDSVVTIAGVEDTNIKSVVGLLTGNIEKVSGV